MLKNKTNVASRNKLMSFERWIRELGGKNRVSIILGIDRTTIHRWETGELELPKWAACMMAMSCENSDLKKENRKLKKEVKK